MMTTTSYKVAGMTCEHCVSAVTSELGSLSGVSAVKVDLVPSGVSLVTITSTGPLPEDEVSAALDEAGDYRISGN
jgi:copper chaperone